MTTEITPEQHRTRIAAVVAAGAVLVCFGALVIARVVPQKLLLATAVIVFLVTVRLSSNVLKGMGVAAFAIGVSGYAWAFGVWASFKDLPLWPGLTLAAVVAAVAGAMAARNTRDLTDLTARMVPVRSVFVAAMILSWLLIPRGIVGIIAAAAFVAYGATELFLSVAAIDEKDDVYERGNDILGSLVELTWNSLVLYVRLLPDDDAVRFWSFW